MRFVTVHQDHENFIGVVDAENKKVLLLNPTEEVRTGNKIFPASMQECIALGDAFIDQVQILLDWVETSGQAETYYLPIEEVTLLAPIPRPTKNIFCVGKNYVEHALELGSAEDIPKHVMVFTKAPTTVTGPGTVVLNHQSVTKQLDYEGELAVIIGKKGRGIKKEEALDYVFGYTIINDVTARDLQAKHKQFFIGKSLDTTCPMGPWIVHKSLIENPNHLHIETRVNGEIRQSSNTEKFIFPIEEIISVLSAGMTLEPGDIIATGTPAGVGKGFNPPRFLKPGDQMEIIVESIGTLTNTIEE
ncbi:2-keto-4-pentenoate hydratase/2-oxohepta-3-ene-1,7-dioic acid hydratase in catechol pathway [Bacillus sp. SLBN-46]|uniref:fumarylacetoacetate hydrolase family protein n=1 Tax=Bacillus sp. SLBN-46 TaxID=3042283 RepID=UPI0028634C74|nr:fumarylacetoacetate hydrolase family protein [Bacillus sp. SLBN-46]MDR6124601.1 2-keto-4-pentenoate hydratase/2-oxohepta-3-ene-1,7-dioic acid hydratase in catechol pathway [Bacillus sp. SLBN-46]